MPGKLAEQLIAFAREEFQFQGRASESDGGGGFDASLEAVLRQVAKTKKVDPDAFLAQHRQIWEPPDGLQHVWEMFCRLSGRRRMGWSAPEPIGYLEIEAFGRLHGIQLSPWQVDLISRLDSEFLSSHARPRGTRTQNQLDPSGDGGEAPGGTSALGKRR